MKKVITVIGVFLIGYLSLFGQNEGIKSYSKFDFVPGDKIIFFDDYQQDNIGDFPALWNTTGTGEVVTLSGYAGKWLKLKTGSVYVPEFNATLPENFTVEFDLLISCPNTEDNYALCEINIGFAAKNPDDKEIGGPNAEELGTADFYTYAWLNNIDESQFFAEGMIDLANGERSREELKEIHDNVPAGKINKIIKVSISVNGKRFRLWFDDKKIFDLPKFVNIANYNMMRFGVTDFNEEIPNIPFLSNLKISVGSPDLRSKVTTLNKFVTHGILFDSGSDIIKNESYGTLKEIASILKENASINYKMVGHTDSDGDEKTNLALSKKRAEAVKNVLVNVFGLNADRFTTDGMGEKEFVSDNNNSVGKALNRRVEFIKM